MGKMGRRLFISQAMLLAIMLHPTIHALAFVGTGDGFVVRRRFRSRKFPEKAYRSTEEFWADHFEPLAAELNRNLQSLGLFVGAKSWLEPDGRTVVHEKTYRNEAAHRVFVAVQSRLVKQDEFALEVV